MSANRREPRPARGRQGGSLGPVVAGAAPLPGNEDPVAPRREGPRYCRLRRDAPRLERWLPLKARVWLALCGYANESGGCWPSRGRLCAECGASRDAIRRAIRELVEVGAVVVERRGAGRLSSRYRIRSADTREGAQAAPSQPLPVARAGEASTSSRDGFRPGEGAGCAPSEGAPCAPQTTQGMIQRTNLSTTARGPQLATQDERPAAARSVASGSSPPPVFRPLKMQPPPTPPPDPARLAELAAVYQDACELDPQTAARWAEADPDTDIEKLRQLASGMVSVPLAGRRLMLDPTRGRDVA